MPRKVTSPGTPLVDVVDYLSKKTRLDIVNRINTAAKEDTGQEFKASVREYRKVVEENLPIIYVLIPSDVSNALYEVLINDSNNFEFASAESIKTITKGGITRAIQSKFSGERSIALKPRLEDLNIVYNQLIDAYNNRDSEYAYRNFASRKARSIKSILRPLRAATFVIADARDFLMVQPGGIPIISSNFVNARTWINKRIYAGLKEYLTTKKIRLSKDFKIGDHVHAGHTGVSVDGKMLGVNTPWSQALALQYGNEPIVQAAINRNFKKAHIKTTNTLRVRFKKDFDGLAKVALALNISFVVAMPSEFNTGTTLDNERAASNAVHRAAARAGVGKVAERIEEIIAKSVAQRGIERVTSSPSVVEHIVKSIANILEGKPAGKVFSDKKIIKNVEGFLLPHLNQHNLDIITKSAHAKPKALRSPNSLNLVKLEELLKASIKYNVASNMGGGERRDILNIRSGRFASSVDIDSVTIGRNKMISVYYEYMKYPYATFSAGGVQQYPRTRDPKRLISSSIREIAKTQVKNKLRSVNV